MNTVPTQTIRVTRQFDAAAERVFDAWLNPQTAAKFLFTTPGGQIVRCDIDARVGGKFVIVERRDGEDIEHFGEYLEVDRPRRLVFSFAVPKFSPVETRVTLDISAGGNGCDLTLTHEGVLPEWATRTEEGWTKILEALAGALQDGSADYGVTIAPDTVRFERLLPGPIERVWAYLTDSDKRAEWLASGEMEQRVGGRVDLHFEHARLSSRSAPVPERFKQLECGSVTSHQVTQLEPPRLLALTWGGAGDPSAVTFELSPQGDQVRLVLTHRRLLDRKSKLGIASGWHAHLTVLVERLNGREPDAFWTIFTSAEKEYDRKLPAE